MRKTSWIRFSKVIGVAFILSCAAKSPKLDHPVAIGPIKEYDDKVDIKPLDIPENQKAGEARPTPSTPPKLGLEPTPKVELKGVKKKKKGGDLFATTASGPRQPETEDSEGFNGRRPIVDPFRVGEKVTLMLTYFGVSAGDGTMEVRPFKEVNGRKSYHFFSTLKSSAVFSMFYSVDDFCESYVDYEEIVPFTFTLSATESKQLREVRQFFDWKKKQADFWEKKVTKESGVEEKRKTWALAPYSQNIYTALQYVRLFALKDGKTYTYRVSDDQKTWDVSATVVRREVLKTDIGSFKAIVVRPQVAVEGIFKPMGEVLFWFTDDDRKFPIKFESKIKIGKIIGYLKALERGNP